MPDNTNTTGQTARKTAPKKSSKLEQVANTATQSAARFTDEALDTSLQTLGSVSQQGQSQVEDVVRTIGRAINAASSSLESDGYAGSAGYVRAAASGLTQAADEVGGFDTGMLTGKVERFVRDKPFVVAGGLAIVGFMLASTLKAPRR